MTAAPVAADAQSLQGRDLLSLRDYTGPEIRRILDLAGELKQRQRHREPHRWLEGRTLHHDGKGHFGAGKVAVRAAPAGTGIIAGGPMRAVFESLGVADVVTKSVGTSNPYNMIRATFEARLASWVRELLASNRIQLNFTEECALVEALVADMLGLGPLEPLLADETVSDIMVNGPKQVYVERRGKLELTDAAFRDEPHLMNICTKIVTRIGRRVDELNPLVDARLPDGRPLRYCRGPVPL